MSWGAGRGLRSGYFTEAAFDEVYQLPPLEEPPLPRLGRSGAQARPTQVAGVGPMEVLPSRDLDDDAASARRSSEVRPRSRRRARRRTAPPSGRARALSHLVPFAPRRLVPTVEARSPERPAARQGRRERPDAPGSLARSRQATRVLGAVLGRLGAIAPLGRSGAPGRSHGTSALPQRPSVGDETAGQEPSFFDRLRVQYERDLMVDRAFSEHHKLAHKRARRELLGTAESQRALPGERRSMIRARTLQIRDALRTERARIDRALPNVWEEHSRLRRRMRAPWTRALAATGPQLVDLPSRDAPGVRPRRDLGETSRIGGASEGLSAALARPRALDRSPGRRQSHFAPRGVIGTHQRDAAASERSLSQPAAGLARPRTLDRSPVRIASRLALKGVVGTRQRDPSEPRRPVSRTVDIEQSERVIAVAALRAWHTGEALPPSAGLPRDRATQAVRWFRGLPPNDAQVLIERGSQAAATLRRGSSLTLVQRQQPQLLAFHRSLASGTAVGRASMIGMFGVGKKGGRSLDRTRRLHLLYAMATGDGTYDKAKSIGSLEQRKIEDWLRDDVSTERDLRDAYETLDSKEFWTSNREYEQLQSWYRQRQSDSSDPDPGRAPSLAGRSGSRRLVSVSTGAEMTSLPNERGSAGVSAGRRAASRTGKDPRRRQSLASSLERARSERPPPSAQSPEDGAAGAPRPDVTPRRGATPRPEPLQEEDMLAVLEALVGHNPLARELLVDVVDELDALAELGRMRQL